MSLTYGNRRALLGSTTSGGGGPPASTIQSLEIMGSTLLDATGDFGDPTARTGILGLGWVAKATMPYLAGQTFDPTKITINLSDPGYDAAGTTTVTRTIRGAVILRRQYNAQANPQSSNDGITFTVYFTLTADNAGFTSIFQGTTLTSAAAASGYYGGATPGAIVTRTNSSTLAYSKSLFGWLQKHHLRATSDLYVEGVAYSAYGMNGRMVARIEYISYDSQGTPNYAATQTTSAPIISTLLTKGQPPECYAATIPLTALTQGDLCFVNAKVYPWIGDSSAVLDLVADGVSVTGDFFTANPQTPLRFLNDKSGMYADGCVSIRQGASGGSAASSEVGSRSTPVGTMAAAVAALVTFNAAKGRTGDTCGTIYLMDDGAGGPIEHIVNAALDTGNAGKMMTDVRQSPTNTAKASILVNANNVGTLKRGEWNVDLRLTNPSYLRGFNLYTNYFCGNVDQATGTAAPAWYQMLAIGYNMTQLTSGVFDLTGSEPGVQMLGCVNKANASDVQTRAHVIIGCDFEHIYVGEIATGTGSPSSQDGKILANNKLMKLTGPNACGIGGIAYTKGFARVQNITERSAGTTPAWSIAETTTSAQILNAIEVANTDVGDRTNELYCDSLGSVGVIKQMVSRFNLKKERNTKGDVFSNRSGNTGNWRFSFDVDNFDGVMKGDNNGITTPGVNAWIGEYWNTPANCNLTIAATTFVSDRSVNGTGAGGGDYHLNGASNPARDKVPAGKGMLAFYQDGTARGNAGNEPFGALPWAP